MIKKLRKFLQRSGNGGTPNPSDDFWYKEMAFAMKHAGVVVSPDNAQKIATVYACVQTIAESVAMLPVHVYRRKDDRTTEMVNDHPLGKLLRVSPHPHINSFTFFETMQCDILNHGNAYAHITYSGTDAILKLRPLPAEMMRVEISDKGDPVYVFQQDKDKEITYSSDQIFHINHRSKDGIIGQSPIEVAAGTLGFAMALQQYHNNMLENGGFLSGIIKTFGWIVS